MAIEPQKQITVIGDIAAVDEATPYDVVERHSDGGLVLIPRVPGEVKDNAAAITELRSFAGVIHSGGELRHTVDALRDEWPS